MVVKDSEIFHYHVLLVQGFSGGCCKTSGFLKELADKNYCKAYYGVGPRPTDRIKRTEHHKYMPRNVGTIYI